MIKNIVFDIGNVLVRFQPDEAMREIGIEENKIAALAHATYENPVWVELDRGVIPENEIIDEMVKVAPQYEADIRRFFKEGKAFVVKAFDYAADWIKELKSRGYKVYLLSNYPKDFFELHTHSELSFVSLVDGKVISAMVGMIKPNAGIYQCLFDKYNLNPKECVFIDDRPENIEGGRKLGMEGIVFTDYETGKKKAGADADGKIKGRLIKDWSIKDEDSNSICISASWKHKKIIDEIAKTKDVELIDATQTVEKDLSEYDLIGFASGVYGGKFHQSVLKFASVNLTDNKNVFLICTYGGRPVFKSIEQVIAYKHDNIVGRFSCKGFDTFGPFKLIGGVSKGHPDEKDIAAAVEFYNGLTEQPVFLK